jgi:hypothetical protein
MTGWRLFADARKQHHVSWSSDVEYADGTTNGLALRAAGSTDTSFLIGRLDELPSDDRDHLCEEWLEVATADQHVRRILIYRITRDLGARDGGQGADPTRKLAYVCEDKKLIRPSA